MAKKRRPKLRGRREPRWGNEDLVARNQGRDPRFRILGIEQLDDLFQFGLILAGLVVVAIVTGVSLDRLGFPAFVQPIHLLMANLIFGSQFFLAWAFRYAWKAPQPRA